MPASVPVQWTQLSRIALDTSLANSTRLPPALQRIACAFFMPAANLKNWLYADNPVPQVPMERRKASLTLQEVQSVLASFLYVYVVVQKQNYDAQHTELWLTIMTMPETLFGQPRSTTSRWIDFVHQNEKHEAYASRLSGRLYDEVAPVFGVDNYLSYSLILSDGSDFLAQRMKSCYENQPLINALRIAGLKMSGNAQLIGKRGCGSAIMVFLALTAALFTAATSVL